MTAWVYIMTNGKNGTLYIGVTADLAQRIFDHRNGVGSEFTRQYRLHRLVYVEAHATMSLAIAREKRLKTWNRAWKVRLINRENSEWEDLFDLMLA
jgi:putative endonuclease